jgi:hypothetical protein
VPCHLSTTLPTTRKLSRVLFHHTHSHNARDLTRSILPHTLTRSVFHTHVLRAPKTKVQLHTHTLSLLHEHLAHAHQARGAQPPLYRPSHNARALTRSVNAQEQSSGATNCHEQLVAVREKFDGSSACVCVCVCVCVVHACAVLCVLVGPTHCGKHAGNSL